MAKLRKVSATTNGEEVFGPGLPSLNFQALFKKGETGLWEWREEKPKPCPVVARDSKKHPSECRHCGGKKKTLRLSEEAPCLACNDGKIYCHKCGGSGKLLVRGNSWSSTASPSSCAGCAGKGKFKCTICKGRRIVKYGSINAKKICDAKKEDIKKRRDDLTLVARKIVDAMRQEGQVAVAKSRKFKRKVSYVGRHVALMAKLRKNQNRMKGYVGGSSFEGEVTSRFITMIESQLDRELGILEYALERFDRNGKILRKKLAVPAESQTDK